MAKYATRISGGRVYSNGGLVELDVLIEGGLIVGLLRAGEAADAHAA